jgi:hypothetical protein
MPKRESFEDFYYRNVGIGEGCGCAESVIDVYEAKRKGEAKPDSADGAGTSFLARLAAWLGARAKG